MTHESRFTPDAASTDTQLDLTLLERIRRPDLAQDVTWNRVTAPVASRPPSVPAPAGTASDASPPAGALRRGKPRRRRQWRIEAIVATWFALVCAALLGVIAFLGVSSGVLPPLVAGALVLGGLLALFGVAVIVLLALA